MKSMERKRERANEGKSDSPKSRREEKQMSRRAKEQKSD